ncbi:MAG TPA: hypothetical protein VGP72_09155 [Planctomycetota bacterium]|jgi:hypothetical protein
MSSPDHSIPCSCGQVVFDVTSHRTGDRIVCPWCNKEYRYLGGNVVELMSEEDKKEAAKFEVLQGSAEVFHFDDPEEKQPAKGPPRRTAGRSARSSGQKDGENGKKAAQRPKDTPGGILPMVGFMVAGPAVVLVILLLTFPEVQHHKGVHETPWGDQIQIGSPWMELIGMLLGELLGFGGWVCYLYRLHCKRKAAAAACDSAQATVPTSKKPSSRKESVSKEKPAAKAEESAKPQAVLQDKPAVKDNEEDDESGGIDAAEELEEIVEEEAKKADGLTPPASSESVSK